MFRCCKFKYCPANRIGRNKNNTNSERRKEEKGLTQMIIYKHINIFYLTISNKMSYLSYLIQITMVYMYVGQIKLVNIFFYFIVELG